MKNSVSVFIFLISVSVYTLWYSAGMNLIYDFINLLCILATSQLLIAVFLYLIYFKKTMEKFLKTTSSYFGTTLFSTTSYVTRYHNGFIFSLAPKLGCHYFSSFYGLNAVISDDNLPLRNFVSRTFLLPFKSDSYLDVITLLSSKLNRDVPYCIIISCPTSDNVWGETIAHSIFFCFSDNKYKYVNTDLNILTHVLHVALHVQNKFLYIALHVSIDFTLISHDYMLDYYNDDCNYFYRDSDYSYDNSGFVFKKSDYVDSKK